MVYPVTGNCIKLYLFTKWRLKKKKKKCCKFFWFCFLIIVLAFLYGMLYLIVLCTP